MFEVNRVYQRGPDIHAHYGGQEQGGISTPQHHPFIFLFTGQTGEQYGYHDGWDQSGVFVYTGEGQVGPMEFVRGNRAIREHVDDGKELHLFQALDKGKGYRYLGEFHCPSWEYRQGKDRIGDLRQVIVFFLVNEGSQSSSLEGIDNGIEVNIKTVPLPELRRNAYEAAQPAAEGREQEAKRLYYRRSQAVKAYVLARANGVCEACKVLAPFMRVDGTPYLEPHHTRRVSDSGPDHPRWVGAVCPNCHREIHYGKNGHALNKVLQDYLTMVEVGG